MKQLCGVCLGAAGRGGSWALPRGELVICVRDVRADADTCRQGGHAAHNGHLNANKPGVDAMLFGIL